MADYSIVISALQTGVPAAYTLPVGSYIESCELTRRSQVENVPLADGGVETADLRFEARELRLAIRIYDATAPATVATTEQSWWVTLKNCAGYYLCERSGITLVAAHKYDSVIGMEETRTRRVKERDRLVTYVLSCHTAPGWYGPSGQYVST
jgi:hypothetical protein